MTDGRRTQVRRKGDLARREEPRADGRNPHTVELMRRIDAILPFNGTVLQMRKQFELANMGLPGAPWWHEDEAAGEIVRVRDGSRYRIEDIPPLCVKGEVDLHAVDEWIRTAPSTRKD